MTKKEIDESELELKFEATLMEAEEWWEKAEDEEKVEMYVKYLILKEQEIENEN